MICDAGLGLFLYHVVFFAAPLGLPLVALAWLALHRAWRWPNAAQALLSAAFLATTLSALHLVPADARWIPTTFVVPAALGAGAALLGTRASRLAALVGAAVPPAAIVALSLAWNARGCP